MQRPQHSSKNQDQWTRRTYFDLYRLALHQLYIREQMELNSKQAKERNGDINLEEDKSYQQAGLNPYIDKCYQYIGYKKPTPIQYYALEIYNHEKPDSIIAHSKSGTGKTLSYLSVILTNILSSPQQLSQRCSHLIILPTRQLSLQVYQTLKETVASFSTVKGQTQEEKKTRLKLKQIKPMLCIGGIPFEDDRRSYLNNGGNILVGTMGRLLEFIDKRLIKISELRMLILDEGDKLFESRNKNFMIFLDNTLKYVNQGGCQVHFLIYSATFSNKLLKQLSKKRNYFFIQTLADHQNKLQLNITKDLSTISNLESKTEEEQTANNAINLDNIKKYKIQIQSDQLSHFSSKIAMLSQLLNELTYQRCLVFVQKKTLLEQINERMIQNQFEPLLIHGSLSQASRIKLMNQINHSKIIIASDLLARGIDLQLDLVILFDAKKNDTFWHRIGRTGRFGKLGVAISLDNIEDWQTYQKQQVQAQLNKVSDSFNKQKEWYGTYMTQLGQWKELDVEKQVQLEQQYKYFDQQKYLRGRKCQKKDRNTHIPQAKDHQMISLDKITSQQQLSSLIANLLSCPSCLSLMGQVESLTNYQFQIKKWNVNHE